MRPFAVAGIQMKVLDRQPNVARMAKSLKGLIDHFPWVQMVVFSELAPYGHALKHAEPLPGPTEEKFQEMAARHGVWLLPGSLYEQTENGIYNTASVISPQGEVVCRYRKQFPFEPYERGAEMGTEPCVFDIPGVGRFGVLICYDIWFPETARTLAGLGAEVILHPTLTDTLDRDVELAIARATAAVNQCYVIDVNGVSRGGNGRSIFVGPSGDVLHLAGSNPEEMPLELDLDRVSRSREVGLRGLGQPLKSFRDRKTEFPLYHPGARSAYLDSLGPLAKQERGTRVGLHGSSARGMQPALQRDTSE